MYKSEQKNNGDCPCNGGSRVSEAADAINIQNHPSVLILSG